MTVGFFLCTKVFKDALLSRLGVSGMKKILIALMVFSVMFLIACQPAAPQVIPAATPTAPAATQVPTPVQATPSAQPSAAQPGEIPPAPLENSPAPEEGGIDIEQACYGTLSAEEFSSICGREGKVVLTPKISEGSCWMNIADHLNNKLTAGFTTVDWKNAEEANKEFDRGVKMRRTQGAVEAKEVGERSYRYQEIKRENIVWVRGTFLTMLAAMNDLCPPEKIAEVAKKIDSRLG